MGRGRTGRGALGIFAITRLIHQVVETAIFLGNRVGTIQAFAGGIELALPVHLQRAAALRAAGVAPD